MSILVQPPQVASGTTSFTRLSFVLPSPQRVRIAQDLPTQLPKSLWKAQPNMGSGDWRPQILTSHLTNHKQTPQSKKLLVV